MTDPENERVLDMESLNFYLAYGYVPGDRCILQGYKKLPPAHVLRYDIERDEVEMRAYWDLPEPFRGRGPPINGLVDELEHLLEDSVRKQLVADVPVGVLLSGGLDSSLITALAARSASGPVRTFTIAFPGHGSFDESSFARLVASSLGTKHEEMEAEPATVDLLPDLARQYDEPIGDSSMVPTYLVSKLVRQHATVALGGDGGDELFGGYLLYNWIARQQAIRRLMPPPLPQLVSAVGKRLPLGFRGRTLALSFELSSLDRVARSGLLFNSLDRAALVPALDTPGLLAPELHRAHCGAGGVSLLQQLTTADFRTYLPDDILVKVDRASMLTSLEVRAPFLDHRVIEFAFGRVPDRFRGTMRRRKIVLRKLAERLLPKELDVKRKRGFGIPLQAWYRGRWGEFMEQTLRESDSSLFNAGYLEGIMRRQSGRMANSQRIFSLVMFELWRRAYGISLPRWGTRFVGSIPSPTSVPFMRHRYGFST
jgi:asparagine synthase (glutamine-hydrolysing)